MYLSIHLGQGGSRIKLSASDKNGKTINRDDDAFWKRGSIDYNPEDHSLMIEKRFGISWAMNLRNKWARMVLGLFILFLSVVLILTPK